MRALTSSFVSSTRHPPHSIRPSFDHLRRRVHRRHLGSPGNTFDALANTPTALQHQLGYRADTDADRLFDHCARRATDTDFFIRKAIGWALRQYGRVDPDAVLGFVESHWDTLSGLSRREALRKIHPDAGQRPRGVQRSP